MKIAVIDVGSNSIRLGIYVNNGGLKEIFSRRISTRLAEGLGENNTLKQEAIIRSVNAFCEFKDLISQNDVTSIRAVATESLRRAGNSSDFINEVYEKTGIKIEVINGADECRYGAYAALSSADISDFYVLDTGGGSAELSLVKSGKLQNFVCLPMGCVVLNEKYKPDLNGTSELNEYIDGEFKKLGWVSQSLPVVVMGGSNKMIAKILLQTADDSIIDGAAVSLADAIRTCDMITASSREEKLKINYMEETRVDIITAGLAPLMRLCSMINPDRIIFCSKSIREGVAAEALCDKT
jgi:exopolyphosphatase/guanosine-5'-triphosphate,3'-diphosphate pyrophosphatase